MARLNTYPNDGNVSGSDKVIGTDANTGGTKNFTLSSVSDWMNDAGAVKILGQSNYVFQGDGAAPRRVATISVEDYSNNVAFSDVTQLIFSQNPAGGHDIVPYLNAIIGNKIIIGNLTYLENFGIYTLLSVEEFEPGFYTLGLSFVEGSGALYDEGAYGFAPWAMEPMESDLQHVTNIGNTTTHSITTGGLDVTGVNRITIGDATNYFGGGGLQIGGTGFSSAKMHLITSTTGTGSITFGDGLYADTLQGIISYDHASNAMYFVTARYERLRIDGNGNVGIGTTSPTQKLHVAGNVNIEGLNPRIYLTDTNGADWNIDLEDNHLRFKVDSTEYIRFQNGGNVGIGTTAPTAKLTVAGSGALNGEVRISADSDNTLFGIFRIAGDASTYDKYLIGYNSAHTSQANELSLKNAGGDITFYTDSAGGVSEKMRIDTTGNVSIGNTSAGTARLLVDHTNTKMLELKRSGVTKARFIADNNDGQLDLYNASTLNTVRLLSNGSSYINGGNVGIGTTSPSQKLDVVGSAKISTNIFLGTAGVSNNIYFADATSTQNIRINSYVDNTLFFDNFNGQYNFRTTNSYLSRLYIANDGNVGIGTTSPSEKLDVVGRVQAERFRTTTGGNSTFAAYYFLGDADTGTFQPANNMFGITTAGNERMRIDYTGNVGIGTTSPSMKLDVAGGVKSSVGFQASVNEASDADNVFLNGFKYGFIYNTATNKPVAGNSHYANLGNIVLTHYDSASTNDFYIRSKSFNGNTSWGKIWTDQNFTPTDYIPTTDYNDFVNVAGDTMTGNLLPDTDSTLRLGNSTNRWLKVHTRGVTSDGNTLDLQGSAIKLYNGANIAMTIDSNGRIGIGTTNPQQELEVVGGIRVSEDIEWGWGGVKIVGSTSTNDFRIKTWNGLSSEDRVIVNGSGNVGIGTTSTQSPLTVKSNSVSSANSGFTLISNATNNIVAAIGERATDGGRLHLYDAGVEKVAFYSDGSDNHISAGNVGIGTSTPTEKLHVVGNAKFGGSRDIDFSTTDGNIKITPNSGSWATGYFFNGSAGTYRGGFGALGSIDSLTYFYIGDSYNDTTMVIQPNAGNVGIGTTSPSEKLHVVGDTRIEGNLTVNGTYTQVDTDTLTTEQWNVTNDGTGPAVTINQTGAQDIMDVQDDGTSVFYIEDGGNVGIGTTSPSYKLDVAGTARVNSKLLLDSADYAQHLSLRRGVYGMDFILTGTRLDLSPTASTNELKVLAKIRTTSDIQVDGNTDIYGSYLNVGRALSTAEATVTVGQARTGNGYSYIDLVGDTTYTDYGARFIRGNTGANASTQLNHRGTGVLDIQTVDAAPIRLVTSGTERVRVTSDGNVGIGTTGPGAKLQVNGSTSDTTASTLVLRNSSLTSLLSVRNDGRVDIAAGALVHSGGGYANTSTSNSYFTGNLGIGTTSPASKLHINDGSLQFDKTNTASGGDFDFIKMGYNGGWSSNQGGIAGISVDDATGVVGRYGITYGSGGGRFVVTDLYDNGYGASGDVFYVRGDGDAYVQGSLGIGITSPAVELHVNGWGRLYGGLQLAGSNRPIYAIDNTNLLLGTNNTERMRITSTGNVGIGTTSPQTNTKLDVIGATRAGGKTTYTKVYGSLDTTGNAIAGLTVADNGASAMFTFTMCGGAGQYQKIVYSCWNTNGTAWKVKKVIDEGTNAFDITVDAEAATRNFTFVTRSGSQNYSPTVVIEHVGYSLDTSYLA